MARTISALLLAVWAAAAAHAQPARPAEPTDVSALPTPPRYESAFDGYRRFQELPLAPWREVNDTARALRGHAGQIKNRDAVPAPMKHDAMQDKR
jgi:hypothetical protein